MRNEHTALEFLASAAVGAVILVCIAAGLYAFYKLFELIAENFFPPKEPEPSDSFQPLKFPPPPAKRIVRIEHPTKETLEAYNVKCLPGQIVTAMEVVDEPIKPWDEPNQVSQSVSMFTMREDGTLKARDRIAAAEYLRTMADRLELEGGTGGEPKQTPGEVLKQRAIALRSIALDIESRKI